jgi:hypothetical protein
MLPEMKKYLDYTHKLAWTRCRPNTGINYEGNARPPCRNKEEETRACIHRRIEKKTGVYPIFF